MKLACIVLCVSVASVAPVNSAIPIDLFPDLTDAPQRLRFHDGRISQNKPEISPDLPAVPGQASPWYVVQWRRPELLSAGSLLAAGTSRRDDIFHVSRFDFQTPDEATQVSISGTGREALYRLYAKDGVLVDGGGSNLFLSSDALNGGVTLEKPITYSVALQITSAKISYLNSSAEASGAVLGGGFTGFRLQLRDEGAPRSEPVSVFVQLQHVSSRDRAADHLGCHSRQSSGSPQIVYSRTLQHDAFLPFSVTSKPTLFRFDVNEHVRDLIKNPVRCVSPLGKVSLFSWPAGARNFANWRLTSMFIGLEVQNQDQRSGGKIVGPQGTVELGLQISNLHVSN